MSNTIIDETVILRYLPNDDEVLSPRAAQVIATRTARVYPETNHARGRYAARRLPGPSRGDCVGHDQAAR